MRSESRSHPGESVGIRFYRWLAGVIHAVVLPRFARPERIEGGRLAAFALSNLREDSRRRRIWFHAASVGELESIWPLIELACAASDLHCVITVFSSSAYSHLIKNSKRLPDDALLFAGYSPFEGGWSRALEDVRPHLFVTAKYEAWPELWHSLGIRKIPLVIIGAKLRSSLRVAGIVLRILRGVLPKLHLVTFDERNREPLLAGFPSAEITVDSDPRWDRVFQRTRGEQPRVSAIASRFGGLPRPWVILGQVWPSDFDEFRKHSFLSTEGTFWFVPHKVDAASVKELEIRVRDAGFTPVRTSEGSELIPAGRSAILVDEMGFLAELYRFGDFAYVGGGFGSGVHSTIEPAVAGLHVGAGPSGADKFDEIPWLSERGILRVLRDAEDWAHFRAEVHAVNESERAEISAVVGKHRGSAKRIWQTLRLSMA